MGVRMKERRGASSLYILSPDLCPSIRDVTPNALDRTSIS